MNKRELRRHLRALHEGRAVRNTQSAAICQHLLENPIYLAASVIGGYMPLPREADVTPIMLDALNRGKTLVLPLCDAAPHMTLRQVASLTDLAPGAYGIPEPSRDAPIIPVEAVDLLLVPLEGIDPDGFRLGKGGGYYDCLLPKAHGVTMGCALTWQWTERVPREPWDIPLKACADACGIRCFHEMMK